MNGRRKRRFERKYLRGWKSAPSEQWKAWMRLLDPCREYDFEENCWKILEHHVSKDSFGEWLRWPLLWDLRALRDERLKTCKYLEGEIANCYPENEQQKAWYQQIFPCRESELERDCWRSLNYYLNEPYPTIDESIMPTLVGLLVARERRLTLYEALKEL